MVAMKNYDRIPGVLDILISVDAIFQDNCR